MKKLRIGVVGTGYLGKFHAEKYSQMDDVELVGIADLNRVQAESVSKKIKTNAYTDHRDLIGKVDAVSVVVPTPAH
ncbi:MAG: Gfo/Idh/MocA family oxidoreductase, partial [Desulfobacterales bacterium]|nr:Gfo/Idh/MocA family oxidoreductase [Desulfobacterales bacterium]